MKTVLLLIMLAFSYCAFAGNSLDEQCEGYGYMLYNQKIDAVSITNAPFPSKPNTPALIVTIGGNKYSAYIDKQYFSDQGQVVIDYSNAIGEYKIAKIALSLGKKVDVCHYEEILYGLKY